MGQETVYKSWPSPPALYLAGRIRGLIADLTTPAPGERVLCLGCGNGEHLDLFQKKGCVVTGFDPSPARIEMARQRLGHRADLHLGRLEDLPFSDNEFDVVTLITSLEFTHDPARALSEAIRVSGGRIFMGILNRFSLLGAWGDLRHLIDSPPDTPLRCLPLTALTRMIHDQLPRAPLQWGSVIFLPRFCYPKALGLEERIPVMNNPFGAFLGLAFPVAFSLLTIQEPLREPLSMSAKARRPATEIARRFMWGP